MLSRLFPEGTPITVQADANGVPLRFQFDDRWLTVDSVANRWRVASTWWIPAAQANREYYKLIANGILCIIYRDLRANAWYLSRIYD